MKTVEIQRNLRPIGSMMVGYRYEVIVDGVVTHSTPLCTEAKRFAKIANGGVPVAVK